MKNIYLTTLMFGLFSASLALGYSDKAKEGKELYLEAKCNKCHLSDSKFIPKTKNQAKKSTDYKSLKGWIAACNGAFESQWFDDEIELVAEYLNEAHYKYSK